MKKFFKSFLIFVFTVVLGNSVLASTKEKVYVVGTNAE